MDSAWDKLWVDLNERLAQIADLLGLGCSAFVSMASGKEKETSETTLFSARSSFDSEIGFAVYFRRENQSLRYVCRVARGRRSLADGPAGIISISNDRAAAEDEIAAAFAQIAQFAEASEALIRHLEEQ